MTEPAENLPLPQNREETGSDVGPGRPPTDKQFEKGKSGNPGGRPKGLAKAVRQVPEDLGSGDGAMLLAKIAWRIVSDEKEKTEHRLAAWRLLAERGWGKPVEFVPIEDDDPLQLAAREADEIAVRFDERIDELRARREAKATGEQAAAV